MHKFWSWLGLNLGKHWIVVLTTGAVLTAGLGYGITKLEFSTGQDSYLNKSDQVYKDSVAYQHLFGGQAMLTLVTMDKGHTVSERSRRRRSPVPGRREAAAETAHRQRRQPVDRARVRRRAGAQPIGRPDPERRGQGLLGAAARAKTRTARRSATRTQHRRSRGSTRIPPNSGCSTTDLRRLPHPRQPGQIRKPAAFFIDDRHAQMVTRLVGNQSIKEEGQASDFVNNATDKLDLAHATLTTTGAPVLLKNINDYLTGGMLTLGAIAVGIMTLIRLLLLQVRWRLLPLLIALVGVIWAFGIAGYIGIPLTIGTIAGLPVMLGIVIDYAIQMHARVEEKW